MFKTQHIRLKWCTLTTNGKEGKYESAITSNNQSATRNQSILKTNTNFRILFKFTFSQNCVHSTSKRLKSARS